MTLARLRARLRGSRYRRLGHVRRLAEGVSSWQPYVGTRGAKKGQRGWKNAVSGRIVYQDKPPQARGGRGEVAAGKTARAKLPADAVARRPGVEELQAHIESLRGQPRLEPRHLETLAGQLAGLTVKQLTQLKGKLGLKASGTKNVLAQKIAARALAQTAKEQPDGKVPAQQPPRPPREPRPGGAGTPADGGAVAPEARRPGAAPRDSGGPADLKPARAKAAPRVPARQDAVLKRVDRYEKLFRQRGQHEAADWMGLLRQHVQAVGTDAALAALGAEGGRGDGQHTRYEGEEAGWESMSDFGKAYLARFGITSVYDAGATQPAARTVSSISPAFGGQGGDFQPADPQLKDKLEEAQHLPGLEKSEDLGKIMGRPVTHLTPDVLDKMDARYGQGQWIIKTYGDHAFAGNGIFFPQRAAQIQRDAAATIWTSGEHLARYGFAHLRDPHTGQVVGIRHRGGEDYRFGTPKYEQTIHGDARDWADRAAEAAESERGAALPFDGKDFMAQPAFPVVGISNEERAQGITFKRGQEGRTHIVTRDGKAELIPHTTWLKMEPLPVVFEDDDTRAMAQAAVDAINALPESERQGQVYAPDIVRTAGGYKVVEANPSNYSGPSGYLGDNPLIIDSYVSHLTGRQPAHVRFIRQLLTTRAKAPEKAVPPPAGKPAAFQPHAHVAKLVDLVRQHGGRHNLADLVHVRQGLAEHGVADRAQQDAVIREARKQGRVGASNYEGRGGITPEQQRAGIPDPDARGLLGHLHLKEKNR